MSVRMRHTRAHTRNRRSHHGLEAASLASCQKCGAKRLRHRACPMCGSYRSREVVDVLAKVKKGEVKKAQKAKALGAGEK